MALVLLLSGCQDEKPAKVAAPSPSRSADVTASGLVEEQEAEAARLVAEQAAAAEAARAAAEQAAAQAAVDAAARELAGETAIGGGRMTSGGSTSGPAAAPSPAPAPVDSWIDMVGQSCTGTWGNWTVSFTLVWSDGHRVTFRDQPATQPGINNWTMAYAGQTDWLVRNGMFGCPEE